jgi:hypothetical protein
LQESTVTGNIFTLAWIVDRSTSMSYDHHMDEMDGVQHFTWIKDRKIQTQPLTDSQLALLGRFSATLARGRVEGKQALDAAGRIMDILEQAIVTQEDRNWVIDQMTTCQLEIADLIPLYAHPLETVRPVAKKTTGTIRRGRTGARSL